MQWLKAIMPKEEQFVALFVKHAKAVQAGAQGLREALNGDETQRHLFDNVMRYEQEADDITRDVLLAVRRSFITPFDRGDIKDLIQSMDDSIDQMQKVAKIVLLYKVTRFSDEMRALAERIVEAAGLVGRIVPMLDRINAHSSEIIATCEQIVKIEGEGDTLYETALAKLHESASETKSIGPMDFIVQAEILDHLEKVLDRFDDVANEIHGIVIENV
jgi:predicted phosphate transport protein (TIGR00153 family)